MINLGCTTVFESNSKSSPFGTEKSRTSTKQLNETDNRTAQKIGNSVFFDTFQSL